MGFPDAAPRPPPARAAFLAGWTSARRFTKRVANLRDTYPEEERPGGDDVRRRHGGRAERGVGVGTGSSSTCPAAWRWTSSTAWVARRSWRNWACWPREREGRPKACAGDRGLIRGIKPRSLFRPPGRW